MGKKDRKATKDASRGLSNHETSPLSVDKKAVDPALAILFSSSSGAVKAPSNSRYQEPPPPKPVNVEAESEDSEDEQSGYEEQDEELSSVDEDIEDTNSTNVSEDKSSLDGDDSSEEKSSGEEEEALEQPILDRLIEAATTNPARRRKRKGQEEDLEGQYMSKLAKEEEKEEEERQAEARLKRRKLNAEQELDSSEDQQDGSSHSEVSDEENNSDAEEVLSEAPMHESLTPSKDATELEKASGTVFLGNVSTEAMTSKTAKKTLTAHLSSFLENIPAPLPGKQPHKLESLRFRSTAYAGAIPKKASFAKKDLMPTTTRSTNAYAVYSSAFAAREAVKKLNATTVLDRHLRVDGVAHPAKTDHRRCVFVGNLGFVDDESNLEQGGENERKRSKIPSDIEEGLWRQFGKAGTVESVRVVRDEKTRVGKGFAYVQFQDPNAVEAALLFNDKKYPPMLPRILRVVRAKAMRKTALASRPSRPDPQARKPSRIRVYNPKPDPLKSSFQGRASKLLGKAGAAQLKKGAGSGANSTQIGKRGDSERKGMEGIKTPEAIVFEGFRACSKSGKPKDLKLGGSGGGKKKGGKPRTRSAKRGGEWKKGGGKKAR